VSINGSELKRERVRQEASKVIYRESNGAAQYEVAYEEGEKIDQPPARLTVPPNQVYVLGDNRLDANDSRYFGPVKFETIIARKL
jgi:signal peptidase I